VRVLHHLAAVPRASPGRPRRYLVRTPAPRHPVHPFIQSRVEVALTSAAKGAAAAGHCRCYSWQTVPPAWAHSVPGRGYCFQRAYVVRHALRSGRREEPARPSPILRANGRRSPAFRRRSFARIARRDISSALNGAPAPQGRPGSEGPEDVAHASCAATWRSPNGRTRSRSAAFRCYDPTPLTDRRTSDDNPGPEGQFRCLHHPKDMAKPPTRGNRARKVNQTQAAPVLRRRD
jgi:hypothetical protein